MDFYSMSDKAIEGELGERIRSLRLRKNLTQQQLAETTTLSLNSIKALESGKAKISTVIAVLRELNALDHLNDFIPEIAISPLQIAQQQRRKRQRQRASGTHKKRKDTQEW